MLDTEGLNEIFKHVYGPWSPTKLKTWSDKLNEMRAMFEEAKAGIRRDGATPHWRRLIRRSYAWLGRYEATVEKRKDNPYGALMSLIPDSSFFTSKGRGR